MNCLKRVLFCMALCFFVIMTNAQKKLDWKKVKVLVYTKNGKGYVHENIPSAVACVKKLADEYGFKADVADTSTVFTKENLQQYQLLIFTSTNNDVFATDEQRVAFRQYIEAGGGFVGVHSVVGTERNWKWFKQMLGASFSWHAHFQPYKVNVIDPSHPSVKDVPLVWEKEDECYFEKEIYPGIHTLMVQDVPTLKPSNEKEAENIKTNNGSFGDWYPAVWYQYFDGGLVWVTTLGHDKKDYSNPVYVNHLLRGIKFVASNTGKKDYSKAYANDKDAALQFK